MQLDDDDLPVGRILDRREALRLLALGGAAALTGLRPRFEPGHGVMLPACVAKPELTVGPYFVDKQLERSDVREGKPGKRLDLAFNVQRIGRNQCAALAGAMVDIWQCDADGKYSGVRDGMVGFNTVGERFMRGYQVTDKAGVARFTTVYPGWYPGRAVHIHFKIRAPLDPALKDQSDQSFEFTSQLFFDDKLTDVVHAQPPYASTGQGRMRNVRDGIYNDAGDALLLDVKPAADGYQATFNIGLDFTDAAVGRPGRNGRGRGRG
jgi:protocatechuate 3,4-dioxygenase beta subunit